MEGICWLCLQPAQVEPMDGRKVCATCWDIPGLIDRLQKEGWTPPEIGVRIAMHVTAMDSPTPTQIAQEISTLLAGLVGQRDDYS